MSFEHARKYLSRVLPWPQDGDAPAYVNIHWSLDKLNDRGKPIWTGRAVRSVGEAVKTLDFALKGTDTKDIYVCLSTQRTAEEKISRKGYPYRVPVRGQNNAVALKSLFIDIDAKPGPNGYASMDEAVSALGNFIKAVDLPRPSMVVSSGGGLHVYWTLATPLPIYQWQPLAYALAEATKKHGLKCDTQCTIDGARVLRVPDTFNRKQEQPRPVRIVGTPTDFDYSLERIERALAPYKVAHSQPPLPPRAPLTGISDLAAGVDMGGAQPIELNSVARECAFVRDAIATGGLAYSNPLWNLTTLIATFAKGGRADAHRMACGHPGYTKEATDELFDRKEKEKEAKGLGWPSCRTISASGYAACAGCPHFAAGKSPLNFAPRPSQQVAASATPVLGNTVHRTSGSDLPSGYKRYPTGIVARVLTREDGTQFEEAISSYPMTDPWLQKDPAYTLNFTSVTELGRAAQICLPLKEASAEDGLRRILWSQGLPLRKAETKSVMEFIVAWIEKLQKSKDSVVSSAPFGWSLKNGRIEGFIYGGKLWSPTGDRTAAMTDPVIAMQYAPTGDREPWIKAAAMITSQGRPALDAFLAASFGASLVRFTGQAGLLMSAYSQETGIGKTTALRIAQGVWGDPIRASQGLTDTLNSVVNKIGELRSLPLFWDEIKTEEDTKKFVKLAFQLSSGKEKSRMTQSVAQRHVGTWQTMLVSASNDSILDCVLQQTKQTDAGLMRVFEYEVAPATSNKGQIDQADADQLLAGVYDNYGVIGLEYAKFLGANHQTVAAEVAAFHKQLGQELSMKPDERFWQALLTCVLMGAHYANKLAFTQIDEAALKGFMVEQVDRLRYERSRSGVDMKKQINVSNVLAQFINAMRARHTLRTNKIHTGRGKPPAGTIKVISDASKLDAIYVHIGLDDKILRISATYFSDWLNEQKLSRHLFLRSLKTEMGAIDTRGRMGAGTEYAGMREYIIEINLANTKYANFIDED